MKQNELDVVHQMLDASRRQRPESLNELRVAVDQQTSAFEPPSSMSFEAISIPREGEVALNALRGVTAGDSSAGTVVYFHGGGYLVGSAQGFRGLAGALAHGAGMDVLVVDFRKAPEAPFPAACDDALWAYRWVLDQGVPPARVVMAGDSAGAGLALSAMVQAKTLSLPQPAAAVLMSPWVDLSLGGATIRSKEADDRFLTPDALRRSAAIYLGAAPATTPWASPLYADLAGLAPILIQVGSAEILLDDAVRLASKAGASDVEVRLDIWPRMPHVWHSFAPMLQQGRDAIADAVEFMRSKVAE